MDNSATAAAAWHNKFLAAPLFIDLRLIGVVGNLVKPPSAPESGAVACRPCLPYA